MKILNIHFYSTYIIYLKLIYRLDKFVKIYGYDEIELIDD